MSNQDQINADQADTNAAQIGTNAAQADTNAQAIMALRDLTADIKEAADRALTALNEREVLKVLLRSTIERIAIAFVVTWVGLIGVFIMCLVLMGRH